jgi:anti-anti-sigma factor
MTATAWSDFPVLQLQGPLDIYRTSYLVQVSERVERQFRVTFDFKAVDFIDAGALSCFVRLHNRMRPNRERPESPGFEASIRLINVQPPVARLIRMVRLDELFEIQEPTVARLGEATAFSVDGAAALSRVSTLTEARPA